jgi:hypothetical protein
MTDHGKFSAWLRNTGVAPSHQKLVEACQAGRYESVEWALEHGFARADSHQSSLLCASVGSLDIFRLVLAKGARIEDAEKALGSSLLEHILKNGGEDTAVWLLKQRPEMRDIHTDYFAQRCLELRRFRVLSVLLARLARNVLERILFALIKLADGMCPELCQAVARLVRSHQEWPEELRYALQERFGLAYHEILPDDAAIPGP